LVARNLERLDEVGFTPWPTGLRLQQFAHKAMKLGLVNSLTFVDGLERIGEHRPSSTRPSSFKISAKQALNQSRRFCTPIRLCSAKPFSISEIPV
jgi:hypothetical protein